MFKVWIIFSQCVDVNECTLPNACGPGSLCTNFPGGHHCECPEGYTGNAYDAGCHDIDECTRGPCGKDALCHNNEGSFRCSCPPGFVGDPFHSCKGMRRKHEACLQILYNTTQFNQWFINNYKHFNVFVDFSNQIISNSNRLQSCK